MKQITLIILLLLSTIARSQTIGGIGAQLLIDTSGGHTMPRIMSLVPGSPADTTLHATDYIYKVNDISCRDKTIETVVGMIRGEVGSHVKITVTDTKEGKRPRTYDMVRAGIPGAAPAAPADPVAVFNEWAERAAQQLTAQGHPVVKTFSATCGNRFFNFEAGSRLYHVMVLTMEDPGTAVTATARVFDNDDEAGAALLVRQQPATGDQPGVGKIMGDFTFKKDCIGVVNVQVDGDMSHCHAMYVVVYR